MVLINSCCFLKSLRSGCIVSGAYTLIFYTLVLTASTFHIHEVINFKEKLVYTIVMVSLSATVIATSIILIIGVYADNKLLLIPWMVSVTVTTITDITFIFYMIFYNKKPDPFVAVLHIIDFIVCTLNVYCLLCVISQFQLLSTQAHRHQEFGGSAMSEDAKIHCITNDTSSCQFTNSANREAANSTYDGEF